MFGDVDNTLEKVLELAFGTPLPFVVSFAIPSKDFKPASGATTLNCYLYDIREDRELRTIEPTLVRNNDGTFKKVYPPMRVKVGYCITAWNPAAPNPPTFDPTIEEHKLLGQVLGQLLKFPTLPPEALQGSLAGQDPPLPTTIIQPEDMRANRDFWNAVGGTLRPALDYSITASLPFQAPSSGPLMSTAQFSMAPPPLVGQPLVAPPVGQPLALPRYAIGGTVWNSAKPPVPVPGVWVRVQETGQTDVTDGNGMFRIGFLSPGTYNLAARAAGFADATSKALVVPPVPPPLGSPAPAFGYYDLQLIPL